MQKIHTNENLPNVMMKSISNDKVMSKTKAWCKDLINFIKIRECEKRNLTLGT